MKPLLALILIFCFGCNRTDPKLEARISKLEKRTDDLAHDLSIVLTGLDGITGTISNSMRGIELTNAAMSRILLSRLDDLSASVEATVQQAQRAPAQPVRPAQVQPMYQGYRDGVPIQVWSQIAAEAQRKWPGDFDMQAYEIDLQVKAYKRLH